MEAAVSGLRVALLAPPMAGAAFVLIGAVSQGLAVGPWDLAPSGVPGLLVAVLTGAYFFGAIPSLMAGLALPTLGRLLPATPAALVSGLAGTLVYALTFGAHLFTGPGLMQAMALNALPAFMGVALASRWSLHTAKRHAEA